MDNLLRRVQSSWRRDVERFGVSPRIAAALFVGPAVATLLLLALRVPARSAFDALVREDSVFEWLTVVTFVITSVAAGLASRRLARAGSRRWAVLWACLAVACVLAAGEEISWGERVLPYDGATSLQERNLQGETTIHNLSGVYSTYELLLFLVGAYGSVLTWFVRTWSRTSGTSDLDLCVPPLFLTAPFAAMAAYRIVRLWLPTVGFGEWTELCVGASLALFAVLTWRRLGRSTALRPLDVHDAVAASRRQVVLSGVGSTVGPHPH